jgi:hypothetical protein
LKISYKLQQNHFHIPNGSKNTRSNIQETTIKSKTYPYNVSFTKVVDKLFAFFEILECVTIKESFITARYDNFIVAWYNCLFFSYFDDDVNVFEMLYKALLDYKK